MRTTLMEWQEAWERAQQRADDLQVEVERLRAALRRIRDHGETHEEQCWALHKGDCADRMQEIARVALAATERTTEPKS